MKKEKLNIIAKFYTRKDGGVIVKCLNAEGICVQGDNEAIAEDKFIKAVLEMKKMKDRNNIPFYNGDDVKTKKFSLDV